MPLFKNNKEENSWVSNTDLMSVLMMIFLFISITYMGNTLAEKQKIESVAITYEKIQTELAQDLAQEFAGDLQTWNAMLDTNTLSIRFENPDVLFKVGSAELNEHFKKILDQFFPRFLQILVRPQYKNDIEEIRIEGHTSSEWTGEPLPRQAYFKNMELSQDRTRKVLEYLLLQIQDETLAEWTRSNLTANGLASSKPILNSDHTENKERSRRVEFRIKTNAEKQIIKILRQTQNQ